jgi:hypothetical protein
MRKRTAGCEEDVNPSMTAKATIKRQLLAWYIDFLFASVLVFLAAYVLQSQDWLKGYGNYIPAILLSLLAQLLPHLSLGRKFLSIDEKSFVDGAVLQKEHFLLMFLATILVLDGTKQWVRLAELSNWPILGQQLQGVYGVVVSLVLGSLSVCAGYWIFKLDKRGFWLTLSILIFWMLNILISRSLMNDIIAQRTSERRALQGLAVRPGEIEFLQLVTTPGLVASGTLLLALLIWQRRRFN